MTNVWVIRADYGKYTGHFVDGAYVGAAWLREVDLSKVKSKAELTAMYRQARPNHASNQVGANVGQLWLFLEMEVGDYVITPCADSQWLYYGRVADVPYYYAPNDSDGCYFPHRRSVAWAGRRINRSEFSDTLQSTLKFTAKTAFVIKNHQELLDKVAQRSVAVPPKYNKDEVSERGNRIYAERIKSLVEPKENGKFIVIDIETGDYEVDEKALVASRRLQERRPEAVGFGARVGYSAAYRIGWRPYAPND